MLAIVVFCTFPASTWLMSEVDSVLNTKEKVVQLSSDKIIYEEKVEETKTVEDNRNILEKIKDAIVDVSKNVANKVASVSNEAFNIAKNALNNLLDAVAALIITCCVIPLAIPFIIAWVLKILFGLDIPYRKYADLIKENITRKKQKNTVL